MTVFAAYKWKTNGHLIADVVQLGYLDGSVIDVTYGNGSFWSQYRPDILITSDLRSPLAEFHWDFTDLPQETASFDVVVFDPPYKLNGTPDPEVDRRYGVDERTSWEDRHALIFAGLKEVCRVSRRYVLLKCQDQVCSGKIRWQTKIFAEFAEELGFEQVDRFDLLGHHRPQPMEGRTQRHAHGRPSTLLVFERWQ